MVLWGFVLVLAFWAWDLVQHAAARAAGSAARVERAAWTGSTKSHITIEVRNFLSNMPISVRITDEAAGHVWL